MPEGYYCVTVILRRRPVVEEAQAGIWRIKQARRFIGREKQTAALCQETGDRIAKALYS
jgi:hypothetical protein